MGLIASPSAHTHPNHSHMHPHTHKKGEVRVAIQLISLDHPQKLGPNVQTAHWQMLNTESNLEKLLDSLRAESNHINQEFDHFEQ